MGRCEATASFPVAEQTPTGRTVVFAGPTLYGWDPGRLPDGWVWRPPARLGDMTAATTSGATRLILIDGRFIDELPSSPAEIFALLRQGIEVWGAASLGALRAVELERYGMRGHGWVFRGFRARRLLADDEVMVVYDADTGRPLSESLVALRYALGRLRRDLPPGASRRILQEIRALYFPERTRECIQQAFVRHAGARHAKSLMDRYTSLDIKRRDAMSLLALLQQKSLRRC